jgi:PAS domain S-box-containing protein
MIVSGKSGGGTLDMRLQNLADNIPGGMVFQMRAQGDQRRFLYVSRGVETLFGVTADAALADAGLLYSQIDPSYLPQLQLAEAESIGTGRPFFVEAPLRKAPGGQRWVQISSARRLAPTGEEIWDGVVLETTQRRLAQDAHAEAEKRLEIATEAASIGIWHWDLVTGRLDYSLRAKQIYGFPPDEEITYDKLKVLTLPEDFATTTPALARALDPAQKRSEIYTYRMRRADTGEVRWLMAHGRASFTAIDGVEKAVSYVGTLQDVTEQKTAEQNLMESEARLRLAISAGRMAVWELDIKTDRLTPSPDLNELYGFARDANPSRDDFRARSAPGETERTQAEAAQMMAKGETQFQVETKIIWPDGTPKWLAVRAQVISDADGVPTRAIGVAMDITARRELQDRLTLVARELQHRVKNALTVVQTIASQTFREPRPYPEALEAYSGRLRALAAGTEIVTREDWSDAGVREVIEGVIAPYRGTDNDPFRLKGNDFPVPSRVAIGLSMALYELCSNAVKYGSLSVEGGRVLLTWKAENDWLVLSWREEGGRAVQTPTSTGFGTKLLRRGIFEGDGGSVTLNFESSGVVCDIRARI